MSFFFLFLLLSNLQLCNVYVWHPKIFPMDRNPTGSALPLIPAQLFNVPFLQQPGNGGNGQSLDGDGSGCDGVGSVKTYQNLPDEHRQGLGHRILRGKHVRVVIRARRVLGKPTGGLTTSRIPTTVISMVMLSGCEKSFTGRTCLYGNRSLSRAAARALGVGLVQFSVAP